MIPMHAMFSLSPLRSIHPRVRPPVRSLCATRGRTRANEAGYALLAVIFFASVMILAAAVAAPVLVTQGRREKEEELIWRGEQHVRAIKLYYRKVGRFPKDLRDLTEPKNGIHFLRKPFKDPMNKDDGSWRFIYVGPGGQLVGSVTRTSLTGIPTLLQSAQASSKLPAAPPTNQQLVTNPAGDQNTATGEAGTGQNEGDTTPNPLPPPPAPPKTGNPGAGTGVQGQVFGGSLIGVASKVNKPSIKFYKGYGKYKEWEFIWDPQAEAAAAAGVSLTPPGGAPGGVQPSGFPQPGQPVQTTPGNPPQ
jgi:type II secretory pathway pseudopilin PulG